MRFPLLKVVSSVQRSIFKNPFYDFFMISFIQVSKFDRWSSVVLKLHGMTGYPVNLMRLIRGNNTSVDFSDTLGVIQPHAKAVKLDTSAIRADNDLMYGLTLKFKIAKGVNELLKVAPSRTIKSVKDTLERVGVPNASMIDLVYNGHRLPNNKRVVDVIEEYKVRGFSCHVSFLRLRILC